MIFENGGGECVVVYVNSCIDQVRLSIDGLQGQALERLSRLPGRSARRKAAPPHRSMPQISSNRTAGCCSTPKRYPKEHPQSTHPNMQFLRQEMEMALDKIRSLAPAGKEDFSQLFEFIEEQQMKPSKSNSSKEVPKPNVEKKEESLPYYGTKIVVCKGCDRKFYENFDRDMLITLFTCWHTFCLPCTNKYIDS